MVITLKDADKTPLSNLVNTIYLNERKGLDYCSSNF